MGFNLRNEETEQKINDERKKRADEMSSEFEGIRVGDGLNVWQVIPGKGKTLEPTMDVLVHYGPFHRCARKDPVPDPNDPDAFKTDNFFGNCIRCQSAWNRYEEKGKPKVGPNKQAFRDNMEAHRVYLQVVDYSAFFKIDTTGRFAQLDKKLFKEWGDTFGEVVRGEIDPPNDMPDDMAASAKASPGLVSVNKTVGKTIRSEHEVKHIEEDKDPLGHPDKWLLQIIRTNDGDTFAGRGGQDVKKKEYQVRFTTSSKTKGWKCPVSLDDLFELAVDMKNIEPEDDSLEARAYALEKFDDKLIEGYLDENDHSYAPQSDDDEGDDPEDDLETSGLNPDDFGDEDGEDVDDVDDEDVLTTEDHAETARLRAELEEEEEEEEDDEDDDE